ncbi:BON domain-containing protein [Streptomyces sp. NPDC090445]|uniref:BON domain-containing protein n=1 Tax=Streptomyces sp. NPDC090445 TaxID=3365963 RepID=UPI003801E7B8
MRRSGPSWSAGVGRTVPQCAPRGPPAAHGRRGTVSGHGHRQPGRPPEGLLPLRRDLTAKVRQSVVERLFPLSHGSVEATVSHGIATLTGRVNDRDLIPMAERLTHAVEGVVDVRCRLQGPAEP